MSNDLRLATTRQYNGVTFDCYVEQGEDNPQDFWATREQIGRLLGYERPNEAVAHIHDRNSDRLNKFSTSVKLTGVEGSRTVTRDVIVYNFKGLLEICRYSNQPKANAVMDFLWEIADEIRRTGSYSVRKESEEITANNLESARIILATAGITGNQAALALDKLYMLYTGHSALKSCGIELIAPTQHQFLTLRTLLTLTEIGRQFGRSARSINDILAGAGFQYRIGDKWGPLELGQPYAVVLDTGKRHSDGTPVRQLKWDSSILPVVENILEASA